MLINSSEMAASVKRQATYSLVCYLLDVNCLIDGVLNVGGDNVGYMLGVSMGADCVGFKILS